MQRNDPNGQNILRPLLDLSIMAGNVERELARSNISEKTISTERQQNSLPMSHMPVESELFHSADNMPFDKFGMMPNPLPMANPFSSNQQEFMSSPINDLAEDDLANVLGGLDNEMAHMRMENAYPPFCASLWDRELGSGMR